MIKSLFYKEWLKTRGALFFIILVYTCFTLYDFLAIGKNAQIRGYEFLWTLTAQKDMALVDNMKLLPVFAAALLALSQYAPEMQGKRLKLSLHLPFPQRGTIALMLLWGTFSLLLAFAFQALALILFLQKFLVWELTGRILFAALTWNAAGIATYVWTAAICLEPSWRMRFFLLPLAAACVSAFYLSSSVSAYVQGLFPLFIFCALAALVLPFLSVARFCEGKG